MPRVLMISGDPNTLIPGKEAYKRMRWYREALGELHILVPRGNILRRFLSLYFEGVRLCGQKKFDVITAQAPDELGLIGYLLARRFGMPLQLQIHTDVFSPWYRRASWKERARFYIAKFLIPRAGCIRVVSERIRNSILRKSDFPRGVRLLNISILPIFTDISRFLNAAPSPAINARFKDYDFKMVAVGRFVDKEKNFSMLIEVMSDFVKICPKALLVLAGEGPDREFYKLQAKAYNLENNVIIESWRDDLPSFYKSFDLYLLSSNYEGWGRTVIEAMTSGLPIVMTDVGLAGEVVKNGENGIVTPVDDRVAMLRAVTNLYKNPQGLKRLRENGLSTIRNLEPKTKEEYLKKYAASYYYSKSG